MIIISQKRKGEFLWLFSFSEVNLVVVWMLCSSFCVVLLWSLSGDGCHQHTLCRVWEDEEFIQSRVLELLAQ